MTTRQWQERLKNEYMAMKCFPINSLFSWEIAKGRAPFVEAYKVTYKNTTKVKDPAGKLVSQSKTEVLITMPDIAGGAPTARIVGGEVPFNPNIYTNATICLGNIWINAPHIWMLVVNIGKLIAFDPQVINPGSPANILASEDWNEKMSRKKKPYPCGRTDFPIPVGYHW